MITRREEVIIVLVRIVFGVEQVLYIVTHNPESGLGVYRMGEKTRTQINIVKVLVIFNCFYSSFLGTNS